MMDLLAIAWPILLVVGGIIAAYFKGGSDKKAKMERDQLQAKIQSEKERAAAVKESAEFDHQAQALSDEEALKEALKWSKQ